jgi:hypothetical protein
MLFFGLFAGINLVILDDVLELLLISSGLFRMYVGEQESKAYIGGE